jgi:hypothetical protein
MKKNHKRGRPTKYKKEYCELLVQHMKKGLSFETFAVRLDVTRSILYDWLKRHPEFVEAKEKGTLASMLAWEQIGIGLATGIHKQGNPAVWIFNMKCRFPKRWMPKKEITVSARYENDIKVIENMKPRELAELASAAAQYLSEKSDDCDIAHDICNGNEDDIIDIKHE